MRRKSLVLVPVVTVYSITRTGIAGVVPAGLGVGVDRGAVRAVGQFFVHGQDVAGLHAPQQCRAGSRAVPPGVVAEEPAVCHHQHRASRSAWSPGNMSCSAVS